MDNHDHKQEQEADNSNIEGGYWDGNWVIHDRIVVAGGNLIRTFRHYGNNYDEFCDEERKEFEMEKMNSSQEGKILLEHEEFITFPSSSSSSSSSDEVEGIWTRLHLEIFQPRKLHVASFVARRFVEGDCPPRIRIRTFSKDDMDQLLMNKKLGNDAFVKKQYEEAIQHYNTALAGIKIPLYIIPTEQIKEVMNILSNQAECYLRLKKFQQVGIMTTMVLMLDNSHEKSRLRRAKAELAIAGDPYLIQAQVDLQEILDNHTTKTGVKEAKVYLEQMEELLTMAKTTFHIQHPEEDWDLYVQMVKDKCW